MGGIQESKGSMADELMYIPNFDTQNCPFCRLQLVVVIIKVGKLVLTILFCSSNDIITHLFFCKGDRENLPAGVIAAPPVMQMPKPEAKIIEPEQNKPQMALQAITLSQLQQVSSCFILFHLMFVCLSVCIKRSR